MTSAQKLNSSLFISVENPELFLQVYQFFVDWARQFLIIELYIAILGLAVTVFHLIVLTRKIIMVSSVMSVMVSIAICDWISMLVVAGAQHLVLNFFRDECTPPTTYPSLYALYIVLFIRDDVMRCSTWLSILMTLIRFVSLRTNSRTKLKKVSVGFYFFGICFTISSILSFVRHLRTIVVAAGTWSPAVKCTLETSEMNQKWTVYEQQTSTLFSAIFLRVFNFVNGFATRILPCILLPILSMLLVMEIRLTRRKTTSMSALVQKRTERTTTLVILMAVTFFIANLPSAIVMFFQVIYTDIGFIRLSVFVDRFCNAILTVNATIHCIICFIMSTDYRKVAKKLLMIQTKKSRVSSVVI